MTPNNWLQFLERWEDENGKLSCVMCGSNDRVNLTIDHIIARSANGTDDVSNLQPLCRSCNSKKGKRPDHYWSRTLYFDRDLDTSCLRVAQVDFVYNVILQYAKFFSRPASAVNGKLFCFIQIVGAGKTLGMFCLPFALNLAAERNLGAQSRVDRMLIVTKDVTLRGQITRELREEPSKFGLVSVAPRVIEITKRDILFDANADHDIAVMCPNMLWPQADNDPSSGNVAYAWGPGIERILNRYPLIAFDEMHYAHRNIRRLVHAARHSLVFGFTASPIDACGDLLDDMVRMSVYTYHDAVRNDGSMKRIG
jgi:hypothetical protein